MRELAEQARERREAETAEERRRNAERDTKLRRSEDEKAKCGELRAKDLARGTSGGTEAGCEEAWPSLKIEMLKRRTLENDERACADQRRRTISIF
jgi:hypothetical protein